MNKYLPLLLFAFSLLLSCHGHYRHTIISFRDGWKYLPGDDTTYKLTGYPDSNWQTIIVGNGSVPKELKMHPGYAWYRKTVFLPSSLMNDDYFKDSLKIFLGQIDDCEQVFLNGTLIGQDNKAVFQGERLRAAFESAVGLWNVNRTYVLPVSDKRILWDKENTIAVRVFNQYGDGGMYTGIPSISMRGFEDMLVFERSDFYKIKDNDIATRDIVLKNVSSNLLIRGNLRIEASDAASGRMKYQQRWNVRLSPGEIKPITVKLPVTTDLLKLSIIFTEKNSGLEIYEYDSVPYVLSESE